MGKPISAVCLAILISVFPSPPQAAAQGKVHLPGKLQCVSVAEWIDRLSSSERIERWSAARQLISAGVSALPVLLNPEMRTRNAAAMTGKILREIGAPAIQPLIAELRGEDLKRREQALRALSDLGEVAEPAIPELMKLLGSDPLVARALCQIGPPVVSHVGVILQEDGHRRLYALSLLEQLGSASAALLQDVRVLTRHSNSSVRAQAALAIRGMGQCASQAAPDLLTLLKDQNTGVQASAASALARIRGEYQESVEGLLPLLRYLACDESCVWRENSRCHLVVAGCRALAELGADTPDCLDALNSALAASCHRARLEAAHALIRLRHTNAEVCRVLTNELKEWRRETQLMRPTRAELALRALTDSDPSTQACATSVLEILTDGGAEWLHALCYQALGRIGRRQPQVLSTLRAHMVEPYTRRADACHAMWLATREVEACIGTLRELIEHDSGSQFDLAMATLEEVGSGAKDAVPELAGILQGSNREGHRARALALLTEIGPDSVRAISVILEELRAPFGLDRQCAFNAVVAMGRTALPRVEAALAQENTPLVRSLLASAIQQIRSD